MHSAKTFRFDFIPICLASTGKSLSNPRAAALRRCNIATAAMSQQQQSVSSDAAQAPANYPVPLSPPLPAMSKAIELARAMSASSSSSCFSLTRDLVIFEDEWLIAVNKPQGIYCESVLASAVQFVGSTEGEDAAQSELHLANRLDRDTSGIMLITKSHKVASKLVKAFTEHRVTKTYVALCVGIQPHWNKITIKSGHGRSKFGAWRVYGASDIGRSLPGGSIVREMQTSFEVLSINGQWRPNNGENTIVVEDKADLVIVEGTKDEVLVRARPRSGRTHQIRLHCRFLGIPIRGDVKYEGVYEWKGQVHDFHALHAESLSLEHPITGVSVTFRAPLPSWASRGPTDELG